MKSLAAITLLLLLAVVYSEDTNFMKQTGITEKMYHNIIPNQVPASHIQRVLGKRKHLTERNKLSLVLFYLPIDEILTYLCSGALVTIKHVLLAHQCFIKFSNDLNRVRIYVRVRYFSPAKYESYGSSTYHQIRRNEKLHVISLASNVTFDQDDGVPLTYVSSAPITPKYKEAEQLEWNQVSRCMNNFVIEFVPDAQFIYTFRDKRFSENQVNQIGALLFMERKLVGISTGISSDPARQKSGTTGHWIVPFIQIGDYYPAIEQMIEELDQGDYKMLSKPYPNVFYVQHRTNIPPQQYFPGGPSQGPTWPY